MRIGVVKAGVMGAGVVRTAVSRARGLTGLVAAVAVVALAAAGCGGDGSAKAGASGLQTVKMPLYWSTKEGAEKDNSEFFERLPEVVYNHDVVAYNGIGVVRAVDARTGKQLWSRTPKTGIVCGLQPNRDISEGVVVFSVDTDGTAGVLKGDVAHCNEVVALDARTGNLRWSWKVSNSQSYEMGRAGKYITLRYDQGDKGTTIHGVSVADGKTSFQLKVSSLFTMNIKDFSRMDCESEGGGVPGQQVAVLFVSCGNIITDEAPKVIGVDESNGKVLWSSPWWGSTWGRDGYFNTTSMISPGQDSSLWMDVQKQWGKTGGIPDITTPGAWFDPRTGKRVAQPATDRLLSQGQPLESTGDFGGVMPWTGEWFLGGTTNIRAKFDANGAGRVVGYVLQAIDVRTGKQIWTAEDHKTSAWALPVGFTPDHNEFWLLIGEMYGTKKVLRLDAHTGKPIATATFGDNDELRGMMSLTIGDQYVYVRTGAIKNDASVVGGVSAYRWR